MEENVDKKKTRSPLSKVVTYLLIGIIIAFGLIEIYTDAIGSVRRFCKFEGVYLYEEDDVAVACIFDDQEMVLYVFNEFSSSRVSYTYNGYYYNKGIGGKFLDSDKKWIEIPDAEKAGQFFAECDTWVVEDWLDGITYLNSDEIKELEEENKVEYSKTYYFKLNDKSLTLIMTDEEGQFSIPLSKVNVLTGDIGEDIELMDWLWEEEFGE